MERAGLLILLAAVLAVAWLEARSPVSAAIRQRRPLTAWLALETPTVEVPRLYLLFLSPAKGTADLIYVPETTVVSGRNNTLAKTYGVSRRQGAARRDATKAMADAEEALLPPETAPAYFYYAKATDDGSEPPLAGLHWLAARTRGTGLWREVVLQFGGRDRGFGMDGFEKLRLGVELHSLRDDDVRAAYLPSGEEVPRYFAALAGASQTAERGEVEVLNATARSGAASKVTKSLRARGIDVLNEGNFPARDVTIVYDRIGRPRFAAKVRRLLGCPTAESATWIDRTRVVDASVVLGNDCFGRE